MQQNESPGPGRIQRLLIVDDKLQNRYMLEVLLKSAGYAVTPAKNGVEALEQLRKEEFYGIVSDILMPGMDGFELIRTCKRDPHLRDIPFIFYTATYTEPKDREFGLSLGALRYIVKPQEPEELVREIKNAFQEHAEHPRDYAATPVLDEDAFVRGYTDRVGAKLAKKVRLLVESEKRYEVLFQTMAQGVVYRDQDGRITDANPAAGRIFGLSLDQMQGRTCLDPRWRAVHEDGSPFPAESHPAMVALRTGKESEAVMGVTNARDGAVHWVLIHSIPQFREEEPLPFQVFCTLYDITERKRAEDEVARQAREWQHTFDAMNAAIWLIDRDQRIIRSNKAAVELFRRPVSAMIGRHCWEVVHGTARPIRGCPLMQAVKSLQRESVELQVNGAWLEVTVDPFLDEAGRYAGAVHIVSDITGRKQTEEALRGSEDKFRYFFDNSVIGKSITTPDGEIHVNRAFCNMLGYTEEELVKKRWQEITHPDDVADNQREVDAVISGQRESARFTKRYIHKSGRVVWADASTALRRDAEGRPLYFLTNVIDITDRKQAEEALRDSEAQFRLFFETIPLGLWLADGKGALILGNPAGRQIWAAHPRVGQVDYGIFKAWRLPGRTPVPADDWALGHAVNQGTVTERELLEIEAFDGTHKFILNWAAPIRNESGAIIGAFVINQDITGQRQAEEQVSLANRKLALMNDVTYQDIQNKVTALRAYAGLSRDAAGDDERRAIDEKEEEVLADIHQLIEKTKAYQMMGLVQSRWYPIEPAVW